MHDDGAYRNLVAMTYIPDLERDKITTTQACCQRAGSTRGYAHPALYL